MWLLLMLHDRVEGRDTPHLTCTKQEKTMTHFRPTGFHIRRS
jgi:hypothetical protein